jgi:murein DD-endopeptidase MepM/ murein hydrolase activator NlpD
MLEERFRLMFLSKDGTGLKQISLSWRKFCILATLFTVLFIGVIIASIGIITRLYHNYRIISLENDREHLQKELLAIKERVGKLGQRMVQVEQTGEELRNVANLPQIDDDTRQVGIGGPGFGDTSFIGYYHDEVTMTAAEINRDLDMYERAVRLQSYSLGDIAVKIEGQKDRADHYPSILPILRGRINSRYGWRMHPFKKKPQFHYGVDIPARKGTKILATADGVVTFVKTIYIPNKSYGKEIQISHGYGYITQYAHCDKIYVRKGQHVKRWEVIGEVGDTGMAEGPHLHYEVRRDKKKIDPENFVLN